MITFAVLVALFLSFSLYHKFILPYPASERPGDVQGIPTFIKEFFKTFGAFFSKERIGVLLLFLLLYRFGEAQLMKLVAPFLLDAHEAGGLGLTTGQGGFVFGTIGIMAVRSHPSRCTVRKDQGRGIAQIHLRIFRRESNSEM